MFAKANELQVLIKNAADVLSFSDQIRHEQLSSVARRVVSWSQCGAYPLCMTCHLHACVEVVSVLFTTNGSLRLSEITQVALVHNCVMGDVNKDEDTLVTFSETDSKSVPVSPNLLKETWQDVATSVYVSCRADRAVECLLGIVRTYATVRHGRPMHSTPRTYVHTIPGALITVNVCRERVSVRILQELPHDSRNTPLTQVIHSLIERTAVRGIDVQVGLNDTRDYQLTADIIRFPNTLTLGGPPAALHQVLTAVMDEDLVQQIDRKVAPVGWVSLRVEHPSLHMFEQLLKTQFRVIYLLEEDVCVATGTLRGVMAALTLDEDIGVGMPRRRNIHIVAS